MEFYCLFHVPALKEIAPRKSSHRERKQTEHLEIIAKRKKLLNSLGNKNFKKREMLGRKKE